jgi:hypothetical protein
MDYPANIDVQTPETFDRWRPIGQPVLAIPHLIISAAFNSLSGSIAVVSWFAIIFTGKLPEGLANLQVMLLRYSTRAELYAGFLYSAYPPFDFTVVANEPGGSPVLLDVRPELENRDRLRVGLRIFWIIPAMLFALVIAVVGLVCWIGAFFAVLFTGKWPAGLRSWVMKLVRVSTRLNAYAFMLTDRYPPYSTD